MVRNFTGARRQALHTTITTRCRGLELNTLLDPDECWSRLEGALLAIDSAMADKMDKGASLPSALLCLVSEAATTLLSDASITLTRGDDGQDVALQESHQGSGSRAQTYLSAHRDYDRLCGRLHAEKKREEGRTDEEEIGEQEEAGPAHCLGLQRTDPARTPPQALLHSRAPSDLRRLPSTPTRNAHRSWDSALSARDTGTQN